MIFQYEIKATDGLTKATIIPEYGGGVSSIVFPFLSGTREILFQHDYAWDNDVKDLRGGLPFLFPFCGRGICDGKLGQYNVNGKLYDLAIHGFSWHEKWSVRSIADNAIEIVLTQNENTLQHYPFHFEVSLRYEVLPGKLLCHQVYKNNESIKSMPYYAGFHPYFLTPKLGEGKERVVINFEALRRLQYNDQLTDIVGEIEGLKMPANITNAEINEQLSVLGSNKTATLVFSNKEELLIYIDQNSDFFPYLQLYTIAEKPFFCVEHWMGFPNAINAKSGVRWLKPGENESATYCISMR